MRTRIYNSFFYRYRVLVKTLAKPPPASNDAHIYRFYML